jgi:hypothetical protein
MQFVAVKMACIAFRYITVYFQEFFCLNIFIQISYIYSYIYCFVQSGWSIPVELVIGPHQGISYVTDSAVQVGL